MGPPRLGKAGGGVGGNLPWHWACWARFWWGHYMVCHLGGTPCWPKACWGGWAAACGPPRLGKARGGVGTQCGPFRLGQIAPKCPQQPPPCHTHLKFDSNLIFENIIVYFLCVAAPWPPKACISWGGCGWQLAMPLGALAATWVAASLHNIFDVWVFCSYCRCFLLLL